MKAGGGFSELSERAREIFRRLVETYIATGHPVGSRTLSRAPGINLSPASVRNVMADLEELGLIYAPHTSAGRLPTQRGLRFFVDAVMEEAVLPPDEQARIDAMLADIDTSAGVERALEEASGILSGLSHCAGLVVIPRRDPPVKHIEFVRLSPERALVILVGEDGTVENRAIVVPPEMPTSTLEQAANYLNARFAGLTISQIAERMEEEIETLKRELDELSAQLVAQGLAVWSGEGEEKRLIVRGQANLIGDEELASDLERLRQLFADIEEKRGFTELLSLAEEGEGVRIFIGRENRLFSLSGSSVIVAPFRDSGHDVVGVLGVIGPTRMPYARIIPVVDYTARAISRLLS
jgi:heat-inducible transcriptional repressor